MSRTIIFLAATMSGSALLAQQATGDGEPSELQTNMSVAELVLGLIHYTRWPDGMTHLQLCILGEAAQADSFLNYELHIGDFTIDSRVIDSTQIS